MTHRPSTHRYAPSRRPWSTAALLLVLCALAGSSPALRANAQQPELQGIAPEAVAQIQALLAQKLSRTAVEQKIDSQLLYEIRMRAGQPVASGLQTVATDVPYADDGHAVVDVRAQISPALTTAFADLGVEVISSSPEASSLRVHVAIDRIEALAALPEVTSIVPRQDAMTSGHVPVEARPGFRRRAAAVRRFLTGATARSDQQSNIVSGPTGVGSRSSEGDITHLAVAARTAFGVNGTGIKIGVLSDGVRNLAASQALGDLGPVTVIGPASPCAATSTCDEGTAMLEIVHDLAPGAQLYFASAFVSITSFASNIRALRTAGCDIIVDDVFYFAETPFQDGQAASVVSPRNAGVVAQAVADVTAAGASYFSSAGNSGNQNDGTSGTWEGDFVSAGPAIGPLTGAGLVHQFPGGLPYDVVTAVGQSQYNLFWSDPIGGSSNDYDLFALNAAGTSVIAASTGSQTGTQDPFEAIGPAPAGSRLVVVLFSGAPRFLRLVTNRGRLSVNTPGVTAGHSTVAAAFGVAATPAVGPFPLPHNSGNSVETFSSDGPRKLFFTANGAFIGTPGDFLSTGGIVRQKPDITAADGTTVTGVGGFPSPFFGTSAAAPHAAAIAALLKSANPALTPAQIRAALVASAIDIEAPGVDRDSGVGIIMANTTLLSAGIAGTAALFMDLQVTDNPGNGNGAAEAGEGAKLVIPLSNYGAVPATAISAQLTSATPGITITQPASTPYPNLGVSATGPNGSPLLFTIASNFPCPRPATFTLTVNYSGGPSPRVFTFDVPIGPPAFDLTTTLDTTAPPSSPGVATATGAQFFRLFRDGIASSCGTAKAFPGLAANTATPVATNRQFDSYTFSTCAISAPSCATVTMQGANAINLFTAAYAPTFNPANIAQNYKADPGTSAASRTFSFDLPGGASTFAIDVHDVPQGLAAPSGSLYNLRVSGACLGACKPPNQVPVARAKNVTVSAGANCTANASVDDGSSDPDGDALTITQSPAGPYPLGTTSVLLTVSDPSGATSQATGSVTVVDTTPPGVSNVSVSTASLWPPNHKMVNITVGYNLTDNCSSVSCVLSVTSNEPPNGLGDGNTEPDWVVVDSHHVQLRAERSGTGNGRIYTIKLTCTDASGNITVKTATVTVSH